MTRRERIDGLTVSEASDAEMTFFGALIVEFEDGAYNTVVNGRATARKATATNDFALNQVGHGVGDEVVLATSPLKDMPVIVGHSPWLLNMEGTEYGS